MKLAGLVFMVCGFLVGCRIIHVQAIRKLFRNEAVMLAEWKGWLTAAREFKQLPNPEDSPLPANLAKFNAWQIDDFDEQSPSIQIQSTEHAYRFGPLNDEEFRPTLLEVIRRGIHVQVL